MTMQPMTDAQLMEIAQQLATRGFRIGSQGKVYVTAQAKPNFSISKSAKGNEYANIKFTDNSRSLLLYKSDRSPSGFSGILKGAPGKRGSSPFLNFAPTEFQILPNGVHIVLDFPLTPDLIKELENWKSGTTIPIPTQTPQSQAPVSNTSQAQGVTPQMIALLTAQQKTIFDMLKQRGVTESEAFSTASKI